MTYLLISYFLFFLMILPPPRPTLFPYTTLFRSRSPASSASAATSPSAGASRRRLNSWWSWVPCSARRSTTRLCTVRSEEHTSELQSQFHLVCRLLLEKKNKIRSKDRRRSASWRH